MEIKIKKQETEEGDGREDQSKGIAEPLNNKSLYTVCRE